MTNRPSGHATYPMLNDCCWVRVEQFVEGLVELICTWYILPTKGVSH